jgi:glycine cleavage system H protein
MLAKSDSPGVLPCVWMSAGLVSFKLCDREGECEGCPFDRVMRRLAVEPGREPGTDPGEPAPAPWAFPADRGYHRGHGWARPAGAGRLRLGVDALVARLWRRVSGVVLPALGSRLAAGETACWLQDGPELLALPAAVAGTVVARNGAVLADPALVAASPYEAGWLFELEEGAAGAPLLSAEEARAAAAAVYRGFQAAAGRALGRGAPELAGLGPTLPDGGEPLTDLRAMLGPPRYAALARRYLSLRAGRRPPPRL